ncbi:MAG TPA: response regulator transcription factor [Lacipirellulaceae bacterium]|jgi:DNA-binding NarL/FixJ family response regulator|nr:response regulator transcription factor [Lacipirellulaceae bacterium]
MNTHYLEKDSTLPQFAGKIWRTLIVDDHPLFRHGLRELLKNEPDLEFCGEAESEDQAFKLFCSTQFDLVTVDISLQSGQGLNLVSRIKANKPSVSILVMSMFDDRVYAERALAAGASGYVCKQSTNQEIIDVIRTVRSGSIYVRQDILERIALKKVGRKSSLSLENDQLSDRELEVFTLIGQGRTTQAIAKELRLAVSTVETYRERLKSKLNLDTGTELTRRAILWVLQNS